MTETELNAVKTQKSMVAVECKVCGNIFGVYADEANIKKFCSKCYNKLRAKREENMDNTIKGGKEIK